MESEQKLERRKFEQTKALVRIALKDGMTQEDIARLCRVQQSIVSAWANGRSKAKEDQIAGLLERYASRLNRTTARTYLTLGEPTARWEDSEVAARIAALEHLEAQERVSGQVDSGASQALADGVQALELSLLLRPHSGCDLKLLSWLARADFMSRSCPEILVQIEGQIIFRHVFLSHFWRQSRRGLELDGDPKARWLLHDHRNGRFTLVQQSRRQLAGSRSARWLQKFDRHGQVWSEVPLSKLPECSFALESADDAARWESIIHAPMDLEALLGWADRYLGDPKTFHSPHDEQTVPFLLRKALVEHGHTIPGLVRVTGR